VGTSAWITLGFGLLALAFGSLEVVLDKGQQEDWFGSSFIVTFMVIFAVCLIAVIFWELHLAKTKERPILDLNLFRNRTFGISVLLMFVLGSALYGINTLLPQLLQRLMGYSAEQAGLTLSTGGLATLLAMPIVGLAVGKMDPRKLIALGYIMTAGALFYMSGLDLQMSMGYAAKLRFFQCLGLGLLFVPISTMSYVGVPASKNNDVAGMTNLARNVGGSCGTALFTTMLLRHQQTHQDVLVKHAVTEQSLLQKPAEHAHPAARGSSGPGTDLSTSPAAGKLAFLSRHHLVSSRSLACAWLPVAFLMKKAPKGGEVVMH
jgi:MFS transporter, DHA2 family, multidrug resistance protein